MSANLNAGIADPLTNYDSRSHLLLGEVFDDHARRDQADKFVLVRVGHPCADLLRHFLLDQGLLLREEPLLPVFVCDCVDNVEILPAMSINYLLPDALFGRLVACTSVHSGHLIP